jgi:hypothetical protein
MMMMMMMMTPFISAVADVCGMQEAAQSAAACL